MMESDFIKAVLDRFERKEITKAQVHELLAGHYKPSAPKKKNGRPQGLTKRRAEQVIAIGAIWVLYHDKIDKMVLRDILSTAVCLSDSQVGKAIAKINKMAVSHYIGRSKTGEVIFLSRQEAVCIGAIRPMTVY